MKVKIRDRILLALYAVVGGSAAVLAAAAVLWPQWAQHWFSRTFGWIMENALVAQIAVSLVALALVAWSLRMLVLAFRHEPRVDKTTVSVQNTENGAVRISVSAMDTLVKQAMGETEGVMDLKTHIVNHEDSITVKIDMTLSSEVHIPNVTMLLQKSIKSYIEEFSGIAVREVEVLVSSVVPGVPPAESPAQLISPAAVTAPVAPPPEQAVSSVPPEQEIVTDSAPAQPEQQSDPFELQLEEQPPEAEQAGEPDGQRPQENENRYSE